MRKTKRIGAGKLKNKEYIKKKRLWIQRSLFSLHIAHMNWVNTRSFECGIMCTKGPHIDPHAPTGGGYHKNF